MAERNNQYNYFGFRGPSLAENDIPIFQLHVREAVKNYLADFSVKGGGYPLNPLSFFGQHDYRVKN